jgi:predicted RNA-binding Zn-ribbon protein involved in translation (DUF1610 family)
VNGWKSPAGIAAGLVILAAVGFIYYDQRSQPLPGEPEKSMLPLACQSCGKAWATMAGAQPVKCPFCNQRAGWRALKCRECETIFPCVKTDGLPPAEGYSCSKCGAVKGREVGGDEIEKR